MEKNSYGVAIVGFGGMGNEHYNIINTFDRMDVIGTFDIRENRQVLAKEKNLYAYDSFDAVLNDENVDIVLIATPNDVHKDIAIASLRAGKHVICEKPVTLNSGELEEILAVANNCDQLFVVHQNRRWDEDYLAIKKLYDEKTLGDIFHVESRVHGSRGIPGDWRKEKEYGGGMLLDWGVHLVDRILLMIDEKVKNVYCKLSHVNTTEVDDGFKIMLDFESGKTTLIEVGTYNYINLPLWYACGAKGTAVIHDWEMNGEVTKLVTHERNEATPIKAGAGLTKTMAPRNHDETVQDQSLPRINTDIRDFYQNVVDAIEGKAEIIVKNNEVMRVMKLLEACVQSHELNQVIDFE